MARTPLIAGNWKMNKGPEESVAFLEALLSQELPEAPDVLVCPPYISLPASAMILTGSSVLLGAQSVHWEESGAFTGEIAASMLTELGVEWAIVGHSERRALFGESDASTSQRAAAAQAAGLVAVYCLGETLEQREQGQTMQVLEQQVSAARDLNPTRLVVAYEPVWAIGTGLNATPDQAQEAHAFLRQRLATLFSDEAAAKIRILYGGSLKPSNAHDLLRLSDVDGGLIGGASLDVQSFSDIIRAAADCAAGA
ncbi:MAG: triose-phosphate isomerase [bacterium]|nr:triose-phosphate isomerase [bacterium]